MSVLKDWGEWEAAISLAVEILEGDDRRLIPQTWNQETFIKRIKDDLNLSLLDAREVVIAALDRYYNKSRK